MAVYYSMGICWFCRSVENCDKEPNYKGGQLHRFYCTYDVVAALPNGTAEQRYTRWRNSLEEKISGHHALYSRIILKTQLKIRVCSGVEIFKPTWDILLSRACLSGTPIIAGWSEIHEQTQTSEKELISSCSVLYSHWPGGSYRNTQTSVMTATLRAVMMTLRSHKNGSYTNWHI